MLLMRMKYIMISLFVFCVFFQAQAQTILNSTITSTRTVEDLNAIIMKPGFSVQATSSRSFLARITGAVNVAPPVYPPVTPPAVNSNEVGITEGQLSVSLSGAANYNIPIAVPPGINGVVAQVSLAYNSQGGNGIAGYGWNIAGVSAITRIPSTKFHNNNVGTINYNLSDNYALDGQRLVVKSGTNGVYGENGTEYETENYSNIKITSYGVSSPVENYGPSYFIVEYPDGSKAYYGYINGNNSNSRSQNEYAITYWENPQGVRINYNYTFIIDKKLIINSIKYGTTYSNNAINEINFIYKNRLVPEVQYISGLRNRDDKILSEIKVLGNGIGFRNYFLTHDNASLGYERLLKITEKTGDNERSLNPMVFTYTENQTLYTPLIESNNATHNGFDLSLQKEIVIGDYDGDGENEFFVSKGNTNPYVTIHKILDNHNVSFILNKIPSFSDLNSISYRKFALNSLDNNSKISSKQNLATLGGGGANANIKLYSYNKSSESFDFEYERSFTSINSSFFNSSNQTAYGNANNGQQFQSTVSGDFDGNYLTDIVLINIRNGFAYTQFVNLDRRLTSNFAVNSGTIDIGMSTYNWASTIGIGTVTITGTSIFKEGDINGDGKMDLILFRGAPYNDIKGYTLENNNFVPIINWSYNLPGNIGDESGYSYGKKEFPIIMTFENASKLIVFKSKYNCGIILFGMPLKQSMEYYT